MLRKTEFWAERMYVCVYMEASVYALAVAERPKLSEELQPSHSKMFLPLLFDSSLFYYSFYLSAWYLDCCAVQYYFASRLTSWLVVWCPLIPKNRTSFSHFSERILHTLRICNDKYMCLSNDDDALFSRSSSIISTMHVCVLLSLTCHHITYYSHLQFEHSQLAIGLYSLDPM